jgi:hypothetical protein
MIAHLDWPGNLTVEVESGNAWLDIDGTIIWQELELKVGETRAVILKIAPPAGQFIQHLPELNLEPAWTLGSSDLAAINSAPITIFLPLINR